MATNFTINTFSWIWTHRIGDCMARLADAGHTSFEVIATPGHLWPFDLDAGARREIGRSMAARGLSFTSLNPGGFDNNLASPSPEMRAHTHRYIAALIELAAEWGVPGIVISPGLPRPLQPAPRDCMMGWLRESLDRLVPAAEKAGTQLMFENIPYTWIPRACDLMAALDELGYGDGLALIYDAANAVFARDDPMADLRLVQPRMKLVHISDTGLDAFRHDPVGRGVVPFREIGETLRAIGYAGPVVLEVISPEPDTDFPDSIRRLRAMGW